MKPAAKWVTEGSVDNETFWCLHVCCPKFNKSRRGAHSRLAQIEQSRGAFWGVLIGSRTVADIIAHPTLELAQQSIECILREELRETIRIAEEQLKALKP